MKQNYFLKMIQHLWQEEEVVLYGYLLKVTKSEATETSNFLKEKYEQEALGYPYQAPAFDPGAATWAATLCYKATQLLLYRENEEEDIPALFNKYTGPQTPSAIVSADLCLRFVPDIISELKVIDPGDPLIEILEAILQEWHYSGVSYDLEIETLDFKTILSDPCLRQLYCDRIIQYKKNKLAKHQDIQAFVLASLGDHASQFWKDLTLIKQ